MRSHATPGMSHLLGFSPKKVPFYLPGGFGGRGVSQNTPSRGAPFFSPQQVLIGAASRTTPSAQNRAQLGGVGNAVRSHFQRRIVVPGSALRQIEISRENVSFPQAKPARARPAATFLRKQGAHISSPSVSAAQNDGVVTMLPRPLSDSDRR